MQVSASRCGSYSPSARERISDTVLRMVGIAAATAGGSSDQTLHLSRRRAGGGSGFPAPSAQQPRGPGRPPRTVPLPGEALAHRREKEEVMKAAASAELSELCLPPRRERRGEGRSSGVGTRGGILSVPSHSHNCSAAEKAGEGRGETPEGLLRPALLWTPSRPESHLLTRLVHEQQVLRPGSSGAGGSSCPRCSCASGAGLRVARCIQLVRVLQPDRALDLQ
ncbi:hypothetical protein J1605_018342 [Eschrichtius robustus]|uniref:Uncharacterized protein n=1 Tax=Eschrichtius robustus TaxID=9764 RepID=A0AB34HU87_ESCRO|nr:hypothetical protein J1605_018342 [Eschrichtius robustus]